MSAYELPDDKGSLVKNTEGPTPNDSDQVGPTAAGPLSTLHCGAPEDDSAKIPRGLTPNRDGQRSWVHGKSVPTASAGLHPDLDVRSIPTQVMDGPANPQEWNSGSKGKNWMGGDSFVSGTRGMTGLKGPVPPIPTASNRRPYRPGGNR